MKKTLRSVILLVLALSMLLALTACSTSQKSDKVKIGVTLMDFSTEFGIGLKDYMTAKADAMGDVELTVVDAGGDAAKQLQQVETFISQKVDAIIMQPQEQEACSPAIDKAKAAGIPIINCNSLTITEPDAYVGSNDSESAEIAMTYIGRAARRQGQRPDDARPPRPDR